MKKQHVMGSKINGKSTFIFTYQVGERFEQLDRVSVESLEGFKINDFKIGMNSLNLDGGAMNSRFKQNDFGNFWDLSPTMVKAGPGELIMISVSNATDEAKDFACCLYLHAAS